MAETANASQKNTTGKVKSVLSDALFKYTLGMGFLPSEQDKLKETLDKIGDEFEKLFDKTVQDITSESSPKMNGETKAESASPAPALDNWSNDATAQEGDIYKPFDAKLDQIVADGREPEQGDEKEQPNQTPLTTPPAEAPAEGADNKDFKPFGVETEAEKNTPESPSTDQENSSGEAGTKANMAMADQTEEPAEEDIQALSRKKRKQVEKIQQGTQKTVAKMQNELNREIRPHQKEISSQNRKKLPLIIQKRIFQTALLAARLSFLIVLIIAIIIILLGFILTIIIITAVIGVPMMGFASSAIGFSARTYRTVSVRLKKMIKKLDTQIKEIDKKIQSLQGIVMTLQGTANTKISQVQNEANQQIQGIMQS